MARDLRSPFITFCPLRVPVAAACLCPSSSYDLPHADGGMQPHLQVAKSPCLAKHGVPSLRISNPCKPLRTWSLIHPGRFDPGVMI
jgi:hypothetical protein